MSEVTIREQAGASSNFRARFVQGLIDDAHRAPARNSDWLRFPTAPWKRLKRDLRAHWRATVGKMGYVRRRRDAESSYLSFAMEHLADMERTYDRLADETSRETFLAVLRYRSLGPKHVALPSNTPRYRHIVKSIDREHRIGDSDHVAAFGLGRLGLYRVDGQSGPIEAELHPLNVLYTFELEHYACRYGGAPIEVHEGDIVVDGGGCWGDTALFFADRVGASGKVYCFEFVPDNLEVLSRNLARNPELASRVEVVESALWDESDVELHFDLGAGSGTSVSADADPEDSDTEGTAKRENQAAVRTLTIDDLVERNGLERVDWIKLDVEGAELATLEGARETLRRFKPRLAISIYHKQEDFYTLPDLIAEILPDHEQRLTHVTIHQEETVLFAAPR